MLILINSAFVERINMCIDVAPLIFLRKNRVSIDSVLHFAIGFK